MQQFLRFILLLLSLISYTTFALTISTTKFLKRGSLPLLLHLIPMMHLKLRLIPHGQYFGMTLIKDFPNLIHHVQIHKLQPFQYSVVWSVAVAGMAIVQSGDISKTNQIITSLYKYQNSQGWFLLLLEVEKVLLMIIVKYYGFSLKLMN